MRHYFSSPFKVMQEKYVDLSEKLKLCNNWVSLNVIPVLILIFTLG